MKEFSYTESGLIAARSVPYGRKSPNLREYEQSLKTEADEIAAGVSYSVEWRQHCEPGLKGIDAYLVAIIDER